MIDDYKPIEATPNVVLDDNVGKKMSLNNAVHPVITGPPPGLSNVPSATNAFRIHMPEIPSANDAFGSVPSMTSPIKGRTWAQISGKNVTVSVEGDESDDAVQNQSFHSSAPSMTEYNWNLSVNQNQPVLAMGPGGPIWVSFNGQPLGQRSLYPDMAHALVIPPIDSGDIKTGPRKHGIMMKSVDIKFVINKVMGPLEILDPFSDDFYFLQFALKKNNRERQAAATSGGKFVPPLIIPLPAWKATRERVKQQLLETKLKQEGRSRQWEEKEKVLGHLTKSDASKPRSVLSMSSINDVEIEKSEVADVGEYRIPFTTRLWGMRLAVQRGHEALSTVQELQHLLSQPVIMSSPTARDELMTDMDRAIKLLSTSVGVKPNVSVKGDIILEGGLVAAILQATKGKKLMYRSIELLDDEKRWTLIPVILARVLLTDRDGQNDDDQEVEEQLLKIISKFVNQSCDRLELSMTNDETSVTKDTHEKLLAHLWQCLRSVVVSQTEKSVLQKALLSSRVRAEVLQSVVQTGDRILSCIEDRCHDDRGTKWKQIKEAFMCMLDTQNKNESVQ